MRIWVLIFSLFVMQGTSVVLAMNQVDPPALQLKHKVYMAIVHQQDEHNAHLATIINQKGNHSFPGVTVPVNATTKDTVIKYINSHYNLSDTHCRIHPILHVEALSKKGLKKIHDFYLIVTPNANNDEHLIWKRDYSTESAKPFERYHAIEFLIWHGVYGWGDLNKGSITRYLKEITESYPHGAVVNPTVTFDAFERYTKTRSINESTVRRHRPDCIIF
ncbi:MAG TPA: hypothetical protein VNJ29_01715 [Candidatus Nitrosotenuis sp.]|nr:hypothetical protein [Candidatus Nitrosotenuis sp.]